MATGLAPHGWSTGYADCTNHAKRNLCRHLAQSVDITDALTPKATLIKSTLIGDLLILLRKHRIKAALTALAHSRLNKSALP
jgi:hypothetical protein